MAARKYSEKFYNLLSYTRLFCYICGIDILDENYKPGLRTLAIFLLINMAICLIIHTAFKGLILYGDFYTSLRSIACIGTAVQGYAKLLSILLYKKNFRFLYKEISEIYETYEQKPLSYQKWLKYNISLIKKLLFLLCMIALATGGFVVGLPTYSLIVANKRIEMFSLRLPFLDFESDVGFYATMSCQFLCVFFGAVGNTAIDSFLFIYAAHIPMLKNILQCKLDDLNEIIEKSPRDPEKSKGPLIEIFKWHQKYIIFCNTIRSSFFWVIFVQISSEFFGLACTTVCMFLGIWPAAPVYLFYLFSMIYAYCFLGNLVEMANDDVTDMIYDSCWYNLTVPEQKMVLIMLREAQQSTGISIGGVAPLSMNTALQLTKTIYTLSMMLKEFLG